MQRKIIFSLILSAILFVTFFSGCAKQETIQVPSSNYETVLKVMTFNIRYGTADDGNNNWQLRKGLVFDVIRENNPDIIGIQEALDFQINELLESIPGYSYIGVGRDNGKTKGEFAAIFYAKDRFIIDSTETFWFSETPFAAGSKTWESPLPRICTWTKMFDKFLKKSFYVFNVHFDHQSQISREKSSHMLVDKIAKLPKDPSVILTGDFNCGEENLAIKKIISSGFVDTYRNKYNKGNDEGTFNSFKGDSSGEKIDFIFVTKDFQIESAKIDKYNQNGKYPSDHFPVVAIIK
jgi:endonuclease/exonuclease/phosphatase family metal-dependent hydrolase